MYTKNFQKGAFCLESGKAGASQAPGWGNTNASLGAGHALPYLSLTKVKKINNTKDASIVGQGFEDLPLKTGIVVEPSVSFVNKFDGLNPLLYWAFGREDEVVSVCCYVCNTVTVDPVAGALYGDGTNAVIFLRKEVNKDATYYIFRQSAVLVSQSGTLTKVSGTGDATITFTAHSPKMYEHIFLLDPHERHLTEVRDDEQLSAYTEGDLKCRMALLGLNLDSNLDMVNQNAMCKKMSITSSAGEISNINMDYLARDQVIGNYSSGSWTYPDALNSSDNDIVHHNWHVQVGTSPSSLTSLGVTTFNIDIDIPLQVIQDTVSGLYLAEPVMEGKYGFDVGVTLSRYASTVWQQMSDTWSQVVGRISATSNYYLQEFLINNAVITESGPDEDNVAKEPLKLDVGYSFTNNWSDYLYEMALSHTPIMLRVRNLTTTNQMA